MQYRRSKTKGATFFFTLNLADRKSRLLCHEINGLRNAIRAVKQQHPFDIDAMVVLTDHLHALMTLPDGDNNYPRRWALIKAGFSKHIPKQEYINNSRREKRERGIWQRRYWEHRIRNEQDYENHVSYIHYNPVKHGHVRKAVDWPHSSIHRYIASGIINEDWGGTNSNNLAAMSFGERDDIEETQATYKIVRRGVFEHG